MSRAASPARPLRVLFGNDDPAQCAPNTSDGLRVYPPDWRVSRFVPFRTQACQLDPGTSPQLTVSAVGSM